jgi:type VI secretion system protein ImpH
MGTETRQSDFGLMQALLENTHAFSLFQAVHLLQRYLGGAPLGYQGPASEETLRLKPVVSLSFPAADLLGIAVTQAQPPLPQRYCISTSFLGLYSSDSPLPTYYTEDLFWKESDQKAVREFLDIFHHRALSLLYRSWEKYRYSIQFRHRGVDEFSRRIYSLVGLGTDLLIENTGLPSVRLLRYAGLITQRPHSASALAGVLRDYFAVSEVKVRQCVERWVHIDTLQQNRLGERNCTLGRDMHLGSRVRDQAGKFRVCIGPLTLQSFTRFLPDSEDYAAMVNLTRLYAPDRLEFDIEARLRVEETPPLRLDSHSPQRLGWTTCFPQPRRDPIVLHRQPALQTPKTIFPWPAATS